MALETVQYLADSLTDGHIVALTNGRGFPPKQSRRSSTGANGFSGSSTRSRVASPHRRSPVQSPTSPAYFDTPERTKAEF
jgi:hypothetical protein